MLKVFYRFFLSFLCVSSQVRSVSMTGPACDSITHWWFQASAEEDHVGGIQAQPQKCQSLIMSYIYIIHRYRCLSFRSLHSMWMIAAAPRTQKWRNLQDFESWSGSTGQRAETISWRFLTLERIRVGECGISPWWEFSSRPAESEMQRVKDKTSKTFKSSCFCKVRV